MIVFAPKNEMIFFPMNLFNLSGVLNVQKNRLIEMVLLSTHYIYCG